MSEEDRAAVEAFNKQRDEILISGDMERFKAFYYAQGGKPPTGEIVFEVSQVQNGCPGVAGRTASRIKKMHPVGRW